MYLRNIAGVLNNKLLPHGFPKRHVAAVCAISAVMTAFSMSTPANHAVAPRQAIPLQLQLPPESKPPAPIDVPATETAAAPLRQASPPVPAERHSTDQWASAAQAAPAEGGTPEGEPAQARTWTTLQVRPGDSLSLLFQRVGLNDNVVHQLLKSSPQARDLRSLHPGEELELQVLQGQLQAVRYVKSPLETLIIERDGSGFAASKALREPDIQLQYSTARISDNLFNAGAKADLPHSVIMGLANIFGGVIDFVYDIREGDSFSVLFEEQYLDGRRYGAGQITAATFTNRGTEYKAYRYTDSNGETGYFNEAGVSMQKAFLRAPVDFTRISSNYNPARLHPIFKTKRPHRGIDYAAARGTPVYATGAGRVTQASYSRANGNYIVIDHGSGFVTKYLHLNKKNVKVGQRVRQSQIVGQVGSTGYATGPHLHYEFLLNGTHHNPRTVHQKFPKARVITKSEMTRFLAEIQPLELNLAAHQRSYASAQRPDGFSPAVN